MGGIFSAWSMSQPHLIPHLKRIVKELMESPEGLASVYYGSCDPPRVGGCVGEGVGEWLIGVSGI